MVCSRACSAFLAPFRDQLTIRVSHVAELTENRQETRPDAESVPWWMLPIIATRKACDGAPPGLRLIDQTTLSVSNGLLLRAGSTCWPSDCF